MSGPTLRYADPNRKRGPFYRALCRFSATDLGGWISRHILWKLDPPLLQAANGRLSTAGPVPVALLETTGAKTGQQRRHGTIYFHDGDRPTIMASNRGEPTNPAWYANLRAHPDVTFGGLPFRAEPVDDEHEQQRLWDLADRVYPPFAAFRAKAATTGRRMPIIQLLPRANDT